MRHLTRLLPLGCAKLTSADRGGRCTSAPKYCAPILQGRRAAFLGSLGVEARLLGVQIRLNSEVVKYWDAEDKPAVVLRSGEVVPGDVRSILQFLALEAC